MYPFDISQSLATWSAKTLKQRGLDQIADWRMLEYWFQVELYRAIEHNQNIAWNHVGSYEQPYYTDLPRNLQSTTKIKFIDLVFAEPDIVKPETVVWIELKDIGRSHHRIEKNAEGVGHDLAALLALDPGKTQKIWLEPKKYTKDKGRTAEWEKSAPGIDAASHQIAQVVLFRKAMCSSCSVDRLKEAWLMAYRKKASPEPSFTIPTIANSETDKFVVFGLVASLK